jgi:hypothetical protein
MPAIRSRKAAIDINQTQFSNTSFVFTFVIIDLFYYISYGKEQRVSWDGLYRRVNPHQG